MSKGTSRRSVLTAILAALFAPWLARRAAAAAGKPAPLHQGAPTAKQEPVGYLTTYFYDRSLPLLTLVDIKGDLVTTYVYDRQGLLVSVQDMSRRTYSW